jgi:uncharacterized protein YgiM (DUF1202 family)
MLLIPVFIFLCSFAYSEDKWASTEINVRTGPGTRFDIMGQLNKNEKVEIFSIINGWAKILFEDVEGYVNNDFLLSERIKTPEEEEAARIAEELEREKQEKERRKSRFFHILIIIVGIVGTILILKKGRTR